MEVKEKDYAFASGGLLWKILDRPKFEERSVKQRVFFVLVLMLLCWLPLAILSFIKLGPHPFYLLFLRDIATHVRFIIVLPILLIARQSLNNSFNHTITFFYETKIVNATNQDAFEKVMDRLEKLRNSKFVDLFILILVYIAFFIQEKSRINNATTYVPWHISDGHINAAGWWYLLFSLPLLQILLYRWFYTVFLWMYFLRKISRINLTLSTHHPDGYGGLGFLQYTQLSFFPVALAFSALAAGMLNNLIIFSGISIIDYKITIGSLLVVSGILYIFPLLLLMPMMAKVKRHYFMQYSLQSWPIAREYEKELEAYATTGEEKPDASWHVDLIGSFEKTQEMKIVLVDKTILIVFAVAVVLPFLPVIAQQVPLKTLLIDLLGKVLG